MKDQRCAAISIAAALLLAGCSRHTDVKLGFVGPLSGPLAEIGGDMLKGAQIAVDELNDEHFVVDGKRTRFELVVEDDASNADQGKAAVERLVASKVAGAIGHFNSGVAIPTAPLFAQAGIPEFSLATNPGYTHMGYPTAFRILADDDAQIAALVATATNSLKAGHNTMVIDDDSVSGIGIRDIVVKLFRAKHIDIPAATIPKGADMATFDFSRLVKQVMDTNTHAVIWAGTEEAGVPFLAALRKAGSNAAFLGPDGMCSISAIKHAGDDAGDYYCSIPGVPASWLSNGINFKNLFQNRFGSAPGGQAALTYESVHVMAEAMQQAGSTDPHVYIRELKKWSFDGKIQGEIDFDDNGDIKNGAVVIYKAVRGKLVEQTAR